MKDKMTESTQKVPVTTMKFKMQAVTQSTQQIKVSFRKLSKQELSFHF